VNGGEKLTSVHLRRRAFVYPRQSSQGQLENNTESTARQYALVDRAVELGFAPELVVVIDEDLGISGPTPARPPSRTRRDADRLERLRDRRALRPGAQSLLHAPG